MKKKIYLHSRRKKVFCIARIYPTAVVDLRIYLPKGSFLLKWNREGDGNLVKFNGVFHTKDKKKDVVIFQIHPAMYVGKGFNHKFFERWEDAASELLRRHIILH